MGLKFCLIYELDLFWHDWGNFFMLSLGSGLNRCQLKLFGFWVIYMGDGL